MGGLLIQQKDDLKKKMYVYKNRFPAFIYNSKKQVLTHRLLEVAISLLILVQQIATVKSSALQTLRTITSS